MKAKQTTYRGHVGLRDLANYLLANSIPFKFGKENKDCCYIEFKADETTQEGLRQYQELNDINLQIHFV